MASNPILESFARQLVGNVRDVAVRDCDLIVRSASRTVIAQRWTQEASADAIRALVPDIVDRTLAALLRALDDGSLRLALPETDGAVDLGTLGEGELCGWYMGSGGWRTAYSKERYNDDFAHLMTNSPER